MAQDLPKLFVRAAVMTLPVVLALVLYVVFDPFKVLRRHEVFYDGHDRVILNRDYVSTEYLLQNYAQQNYDAFILGNSRSLAFHTDEWSKYVGGDRRPFHFDAWSETLFGLRGKLRLLDQRKVKLREALVVVDYETLAVTENVRNHLLIKHPLVSGERALDFQVKFLGSFFSHMFVVKYLDYKAFDTLRPYMLDVLDVRLLRQVPITNDLVFESMEQELRGLGEDAYYRKYASVFHAREPREGEPHLHATHRAMLAEIHEVFSRHGTSVRVVVSPRYDQQRLAAADRAELERLFGAENVSDYSGVNRFTASVRNYYEQSHYRPHVAREILREIYAKSPAKPASP